MRDEAITGWQLLNNETSDKGKNHSSESENDSKKVRSLMHEERTAYSPRARKKKALKNPFWEVI